MRIMRRRDVPKYRENPFLEHTTELSISGYKNVYSSPDGKTIMVNRIDGELIGSAGFFYRKEVDKTEFVKLYAEGVAAVMQLQSCGKKVFQLIYEQLYGAKGVGITKIDLTYEMLTDEQQSRMSKATFKRGINENLKHNIIAETYTPGVYFINPAYIFNGNRLALVKEYVMKKRIPVFEEVLEDNGQQTLPLE